LLAIIFSIIWISSTIFSEYEKRDTSASDFSESVYARCLSEGGSKEPSLADSCREKRAEDYKVMMGGVWENALFFAFFPIPFLWIYGFFLIKLFQCISVGSKVVLNFGEFSKIKRSLYYFCMGFTFLSFLFLGLVFMNIYVGFKVPAQFGFARSVTLMDGYVTAEGTWVIDNVAGDPRASILFPQQTSKIVCKLSSRDCLESRAIISHTSGSPYLLSDLIEYDIRSWDANTIVFFKEGICSEEVYTLDMNSKTINGVEKFINNASKKDFCKSPPSGHRFNTFVLENGYTVHKNLTREASPWLLKVVFSLFGN